MSKKYTIKFLCDFKTDSWIKLFDSFHQLKFDLLKCCNKDANITYDLKNKVVEIGSYHAHFIGKISNVNKESIDKLVEFITSSPLFGKAQFKDNSENNFDEYSYYEIIEE